MNHTQQFIDKLIKDKGPDEAQQFLDALAGFNSTALYLAMLSELSDSDMQAVNDIKNDDQAKIEISKRFKIRTGLTPEEFVAQIEENLAAGYLKNKQA